MTQRPTEPTPGSTQKRLDGKRILVFQDDIVAFHELYATLTSHGASVMRAAHHGPGVTQAVTEAKPDLVLIDSRLTDADGWEVGRQIVAKHETPVVVLTVRPLDQVRKLWSQSGVTAYLPKPFTAAQLVEKCGACIGR